MNVNEWAAVVVRAVRESDDSDGAPLVRLAELLAAQDAAKARLAALVDAETGTPWPELVDRLTNDPRPGPKLLDLVTSLEADLLMVKTCCENVATDPLAWADSALERVRLVKGALEPGDVAGRPIFDITVGRSSVDTTIAVNGHNVARAIRRIELDLTAGRLPIVKLTLQPMASRVELREAAGDLRIVGGRETGAPEHG